jgi:ATP-binding protein involved in chromosome partitioning
VYLRLYLNFLFNKAGLYMQANENKISEQENQVKEKMTQVKHKLVVISGKGGVGKTSVSVNLAYALSSEGKNVAILDIDVHGPNIAKMLGIEGQALHGFEFGIQPVKVKENLKAVSIALAGYSPDEPIIWRGPMKTAVIRQFLAEVNWGALDYLIIDSPPGTGDEPLSVCQLIPDLSGVIIVTTPQNVAVMDARKSVKFARQLDVPVVGLIENMSGFICPHCKAETDIFKKGGGEKAAQELKVTFLGRVPLQPDFVECSDNGTPFVSFEKPTSSAKVFIGIVKKIKGIVDGEK